MVGELVSRSGRHRQHSLVVCTLCCAAIYRCRMADTAPSFGIRHFRVAYGYHVATTLSSLILSWRPSVPAFDVSSTVATSIRVPTSIGASSAGGATGRPSTIGRFHTLISCSIRLDPFARSFSINHLSVRLLPSSQRTQLRSHIQHCRFRCSFPLPRSLVLHLQLRYPSAKEIVDHLELGDSRR